MNNIIEKQIKINAPVSRVWQALTDYQEFGKWFMVALTAPFSEGKIIHGKITYPGAEHLEMRALIEKITPQKYFSFKWHPYAIDPDHDYSDEKQTIVEFTLEAIDNGTLLTVKESGFAEIPAIRRQEAYQMNSQGWDIQMNNIAEYLNSLS